MTHLVSPLYRRSLLRGDFARNCYVCRVTDHSRLGADFSSFSLEFSHQQFNRLKDEQHVLPKSIRQLLQLLYCRRECSQDSASCQRFPSCCYKPPGISALNVSRRSVPLYSSLSR